MGRAFLTRATLFANSCFIVYEINMFVMKIKVTDEDLGEVYHHVHHAKSLLFFEKARFLLLKKVGFSEDKLISMGIMPVISEISVSYKREVRVGEYTIVCDNFVQEGKAVIIRQRLLNPAGKVSVEGTIESVFLDLKLRRSVPLPDGLMESLLAIQ